MIPELITTFESGANRSSDAGKHDYEGFLSPLALEAFAEYMTKNRILPDGSTRDSDNWQKGMPLPRYMKSMFRHFFDVWKEHRGFSTQDGIVTALCALLFNVQGYLHEYLKKNPTQSDPTDKNLVTIKIVEWANNRTPTQPYTGHHN